GGETAVGVAWAQAHSAPRRTKPPGPPPPVLDACLVLVGTHPERRHRLVRVSYVPAQPVERDEVRVERQLAAGNGRAQTVDTAVRVVALGRQRQCPRLELGSGFFETLDFGGQRDRPLDQRRM